MDDEEAIRLLLSRMLTGIGYEVAITKDGAEAIEQYVKAIESGQPFHAVIIDLTIPGGMGGKEAIKQLLEIDPDAKVIVSSGYSTDAVMADYKEYGFSAVVAKPYRVGELEKTLRGLLKCSTGRNEIHHSVVFTCGSYNNPHCVMTTIAHFS